MNELSAQEHRRYARHLSLPDFGVEAQERLKAARVLVIGAGGLGSPLLQYLVAAGVGTIGIVDHDIVDESNLQRQVLYTTADVGTPKVQAAAKRLRAQNPFVKFDLYQEQLTRKNAIDIISRYAIVADGTDNFPTRYLVNDACVKLGKVNVFASIFQYKGQLSVFNYQDENGERGPNFRDLFPKPPPAGSVPSCAEGGVIGVLPGIMGSLQANEVIKIAAGIGQPLSGKLLMLDAATLQANVLKLSKNPENTIRAEQAEEIQLIDYDAFCGIIPANAINSISAEELINRLAAGEDIQIIDVREPMEYQLNNMGGFNIPLSEFQTRLAEVRHDIPVVIHCRSGQRSKQAIEQLKHLQLTNVLNLDGGIRAWKEAG